MNNKQLCFLLSLFISVATTFHAAADVQFDEAHFPDANLRAALSTAYSSFTSDNVLTDVEIASIIYLGVDNRSVSDLTGVGYLTHLLTLSCYNNNLTTIDISNNTALQSLYCGKNPLTSLDISNNPKLTDLRCPSCKLTSLDLSTDTVLQYLDCSDNKLVTLDLTVNKALTDVYCRDNLLMTTLTLGSKPKLLTLECTYDPLTPTVLDIANCPVIKKLSCNGIPFGTFTQINPTLEELSCNGCKLTSLTLLPSSNLKILSCSDNLLSSIDVTKNTGLTSLSFSNNPIASIDLTHNTLLTELYFWNCAVTAIDVTHCPELNTLRCEINKLTSLDLHNNAKLTKLRCWSNNLAGELDLSACTAIYDVSCANNGGITAIKLPSVDTPLGILNCSDNKLTSLDVTHSPNLKQLVCSWSKVESNHINSIDLSKNTALKVFQMQFNGRAIKVYSYTRGSGYTGTEKIGYYIPLVDQTGDHPAIAINKLIDQEGLATDVPFDFSKMDTTSIKGATLGTINGEKVLFLDAATQKVTYNYDTGFTGSATTWTTDSAAAPYANFYLSWSPTQVVTGVDGVVNNDIKVFTTAGTINVIGGFNGNVDVYNVGGQQVYCGTNSEIAVPAGMYVVKVDGTVHKVLVR
jgi:hypothetical protein